MYDAYLLSPLDARELGEIVVENKLGKYVLGGEDELQDWKNCLLKKWNDQVNASLEFEDEDSLDDNPLMMSDEEVDELLGFKNTDHPEKINTAKRILTDFGVDRNLLENALSASSVVAAQKRIPESIVDSMTAKEVLSKYNNAFWGGCDVNLFSTFLQLNLNLLLDSKLKDHPKLCYQMFHNSKNPQ